MISHGVEKDVIRHGVQLVPLLGQLRLLVLESGGQLHDRSYADEGGAGVCGQVCDAFPVERRPVDRTERRSKHIFKVSSREFKKITRTTAKYKYRNIAYAIHDSQNFLSLWATKKEETSIVLYEPGRDAFAENNTNHPHFPVTVGDTHTVRSHVTEVRMCPEYGLHLSGGHVFPLPSIRVPDPVRPACFVQNRIL